MTIKNTSQINTTVENTCPQCESNNLCFGNYELSNDYKFYSSPCECKECHSEFEQVYALEYLETELYKDDDIIYSSNEDMCPLCDAQKLSYGDCELDDNHQINYTPCHCTNCDNADPDNPDDEDAGFDFQQIYRLNYVKTISYMVK